MLVNLCPFFKRKFYFVLYTLAILISCIFFSCDQSSLKKNAYEPTFSTDSTNKKVLKWGVPTRGYYEMEEPLVNYLNRKLKNIRIQIIASNTLEDFLVRLRKKEFDITIHNGLAALEQEQNGYTIVGKIANDDTYRGIILVNKDSVINNFSDLTGKTISSPGKEALAGHMMPMYFLHQNGVNVKTDFNILNLGSFESVILNVYQGNCSAGFCMLSMWNDFIKKRPEIKSRVELKWTTPALPNLALIFRNDMEVKVSEELKAFIFSISNATAEGKKVLETLGGTPLVPANTSTYYPMKKFIKEYNSIFQ